MPDKRKTADRSDWPLKSYKNLDFLTSPAARIVRVLSEFIEPESRFRRYHVMNTVVFFGSSRTISRKEAEKNVQIAETRLAKKKSSPKDLLQNYEKAKQDLLMSRYYEDAVGLAEKLTRWSRGIKERKKRFLICSGGAQGIMEAANRGAKKAGGRSIGLNISLPLEQHPNRYQSKELSFEFHYFFIRKFWFFYLAKALVAFPGGFGTMDELFELLTLVQTQKTRKYMPILIYGTEYWNQVVNFDAMVKAGMISQEDLDIFRFFDDVDSAFEYLKEELSQRYLS